jgi:hypothetical protein
LPTPTPIALALVCAAAAMLAVAPATPIRLEGHAVWPLAWWAAALAFAGSGARSRLPGVRGPAAAWLRIAAVVAAAGYLVRRAAETMLVTVPMLPAHAPAIGRLDTSELLMGAVLLLPALASSTRGAVRGPRPGLLVPALVALGWLAWIILSAPVAVVPLPRLPPSVAAGFGALALAWLGVLIAPPALSPPPGRPSRIVAVAAPLLGAALILILAGTLLPRAGRIAADLSPLATLGAHLHLPYGIGSHVAAGAEAFTLILTAQIVLSLGMRGACRSLPVLGDRAPILLAAAAWVGALWCTEAFLLLAASALGWSTAILSIGDGVVAKDSS